MIQQKNKCIFLDRDGVLNVDRNSYTFQIEDFEIIPGVPEALVQLKNAGFLLIIITNQAGIAQWLHSRQAMHACHAYLQTRVHHTIDAYYSPYHSSVSASLSRKPDTLLFEKAIARFQINPLYSWMIGDKERDILPAIKLGISTVRILAQEETTEALFTATSLYDAVQKILKKSSDH